MTNPNIGLTTMTQTEMTNRSYFHSSAKRLKAGTVCRSRPSGMVRSPRTTASFVAETVLEQNRPSSMLSRRDSVFMIEDANPLTVLRVGGAQDWMYSVLPEEPVEVNHVGWYSLLARNHDDEETMRVFSEVWAEHYWNGDECPDELCLEYDAVPGDWEYRSTSFVVREERVFSGQYDAGSVTMTGGRLFFYVERGSALEAELINSGLWRFQLRNGDTPTLIGDADRRVAHRYQRLMESHISAVAPTP